MHADGERIPSLSERAVFWIKSRMHIGLRCLQNLRHPVRKHTRIADLAFGSPRIVLGESVTPLWAETQANEEVLQRGKVHNLRVAVPCFDGVFVPAGAVLSFWRQVSWPGAWRGFVPGRELRLGCIVPTIGGGLCQLSNALYDAGLRAGFEIVERHAHTAVIAGTLAEQGRDATIFWNYVDLQMRSSAAFWIECRLTTDTLVVRFYAA